MGNPKEPESPPETEIPQNVRKVSPEQLVIILQNKLTLIEANSEKDRQRVLDQIYEIVLNFAKLDKSQRTEIDILKKEIERLQRLCKEHNIDHSPPKPKPKNRKERRKLEKAAKKAEKKKK